PGCGQHSRRRLNGGRHVPVQPVGIDAEVLPVAPTHMRRPVRPPAAQPPPHHTGATPTGPRAPTRSPTADRNAVARLSRRAHSVHRAAPARVTSPPQPDALAAFLSVPSCSPVLSAGGGVSGTDHSPKRDRPMGVTNHKAAATP